MFFFKMTPSIPKRKEPPIKQGFKEVFVYRLEGLVCEPRAINFQSAMI